MAVAAAVTVATVVRLGLHARRDEIEIMSLVGAPLAFIRGPFVAEGRCRVVSGRSLRCCCWGPHSPSPSPGGERTFRRFERREHRVSAPAVCRLLLVGGMIVGSGADLRRPAMLDEARPKA